MTTLGMKRLGIDYHRFPAKLMEPVDGAALVTTGTPPTAYPAIELTDGADEGMLFTVMCSPDFVRVYTAYIRIYWAASATDGVAHTVSWRVNALKINDGTNVATAAGTTTTFTGASATRTQNNTVMEARTACLVQTANSVYGIRFAVHRLGLTNGGSTDSYVGDARVLGVLIELDG